MTDKELRNFCAHNNKIGCRLICPYKKECRKYMIKYRKSPKQWFDDLKKYPEVFEKYCFDNDIPLYMYYEEGKPVMYILADLYFLYETKVDQEQKDAGTDFECWLYDCKKAGLLNQVKPKRENIR